MTLDATYGSATANSYVSLATAEEIASLMGYLPGLQFNREAWDAAHDIGKTMALITAAASIDNQAHVGIPVSDNQARRWPRFRTGRPQWEHVEGQEILPQELLWAQVIEGADLLAASTVQTNAQQGIVSETIDGHSVTYDRSALLKSSANLHDAALSLLRRAGLVPTGAASVYMGRG